MENLIKSNLGSIVTPDDVLELAEKTGNENLKEIYEDIKDYTLIIHKDSIEEYVKEQECIPERLCNFLDWYAMIDCYFDCLDSLGYEYYGA